MATVMAMQVPLQQQYRKDIQMQKVTEQEWMQLGTPAGLVYLSTEGMQQQHKSGDH